MAEEHNDPEVEPSAELKRSALLVASVSSFLAPFMISAINVAIERIGDDFHLDAVLQGWVNSAYLLTATIFLIPFGRVADIIGRKKVFVLGMGVTAVSSFLSGIAGSTILFFAMRALQGVGGAMILGTGVAILTSVFPPRERGKALGINVASVYLGLSLGPSIGGFLTASFGWRSIFLISALVGIFIAVFAVIMLKGEWSGARGEGFDYTGSFIYGIALVSLMLGFSLITNVAGLILLSVSAISLIVFIRYEKRAANPIIDVRLIQGNTVFAFSNLAALINYGATFAVTFLLSLYLQNIKGFEPEHAGLVLIAQPAVMAVFSPLAGRVSDVIEPRIVATVGMSLTTAGLVLLAFLGEDTATGYIVFSLLVLGLGFALFSSPNTNAIMTSVKRRFYGVAAGTVGTMRMVGQMFSMGVALLVLAIYVGQTRIGSGNAGSFLDALRVAFIFYSCFCFLGIFASMARGRLRG